MLMLGGNAFDAAVATAATLNVVEPYRSGVGGIGLALAYVAKEDRVRALNFSGRAPQAAEPSRFTEDTKRTGILAPLVPGNVAGWLTLHETYGRLQRERLFEPAIGYAEGGFPITNLNSSMMAGSRLKMPLLAESLRAITRGGQETYYRGELASRIVKGNREFGGLFTADDLARYKAAWQDPISIDYRGFKVYTTPPNSSGFQILQTLKLLDNLGSDLSFQRPDTLPCLWRASSCAQPTASSTPATRTTSRFPSKAFSQTATPRLN